MNGNQSTKFEAVMRIALVCLCLFGSRMVAAEPLQEFLKEFRQFPLGITTEEFLHRCPDAKETGPLYVRTISGLPFDEVTYQFLDGHLTAVMVGPHWGKPSEQADWIIRWSDTIVKAAEDVLGKPDVKNTHAYVDSLEITHIHWANDKSQVGFQFTTPASLGASARPITNQNVHFILSLTERHEPQRLDFGAGGSTNAPHGGAASEQPRNTFVGGCPTNAPAKGDFEEIKAKVVKAYSVKDGNAEFRAYVILWKGHEVVVDDTLALSDYREGDTINVLVLRHPFPQGRENYDLLHFQVIPKPHSLKAIRLEGSTIPSHITNKRPHVIDCQPDCAVLQPEGTKVDLAALRTPGNAVETLLDRIQQNKNAEYVAVIARPKSAKVFRTLRNLLASRPIGVDYDALETDAPIPAVLHQPMLRFPPLLMNPRHRAAPSNKQAEFFECRNNQVFYIDKPNLDSQVEKMLTAISPDMRSRDLNGFLKVIQSAQVGNEFYTVNHNYLMTAIIAIEVRPGVAGEPVTTIPDPNGKFQKTLGKWNTNERHIAFMVRDDSFQVFRLAREICEKLGFDVGWELLGEGEPIKFGAGGTAISVQ